MVMLQMDPSPRAKRISLCSFNATISTGVSSFDERLILMMQTMLPTTSKFVGENYLKEILQDNGDYKVNSFNHLYYGNHRGYTRNRGTSHPIPFEYDCEISLGSIEFKDGKIIVSNRYLIVLCTLLVAIGQYPNVKSGLKEVIKDLSSTKTFITEVMERVSVPEYEIITLNEEQRPFNDVYDHLRVAVREDYSLTEMLVKLELPPFE